MKTMQVITLVFLAAIFLAACSNAPTETIQSPVQIPADDAEQTAVQEANPPLTQPDIQTAWPDGLSQQDDQGQVEVAVTPLNLSHGVHILDDASRLILTIRDVDAPECVFTWNLSE